MIVRMSFELTAAEQAAITRDGGISGVLTPGVAAAWIAVVIERALREALRGVAREPETSSPGARPPGGAETAEVPRAEV
jgi:hypothetical protein